MPDKLKEMEKTFERLADDYIDLAEEAERREREAREQRQRADTCPGGRCQGSEKKDGK